MNTNSFPSILMLYLPQKSQSCKNTDRLLLLSVGKHDLLSNRNKSQLESSILKSCLESSVLSMTKIRFRQGNTFETFLKRKHFEVFVWLFLNRRNKDKPKNSSASTWENF